MEDDGENIVTLAEVRDGPAWLKRLRRNASGMVLPTLANALIIFNHDPGLDGLLGFNAFTSEPLLMRAPPLPDSGLDAIHGPYPRSWGSEDVSFVEAYFQRVWSDRFKRSAIEDAMLAHATICRFHPIIEWLSTLKWDGVKRLDNWIIRAFDPLNLSGSETKTKYFQAVGSKVLIAAVRRLKSPGCKFDQMMILEGLQNLGKSTAIRRLFGDEYFSDAPPPDLASKDAAMALTGVWCMEFPEIEHLIRSEVETIKAFLSRQEDRFRPPYGRSMVRRPRQGVLIGTTNSDEYLRDITGNRRIWPIACQKADVGWIVDNRENLWAEAVSREAAGEIIWLDDDALLDEASAAVSSRMADEVWQPAIADWLLGRSSNEITTADVLEGALNMDKEKMTKASSMRCAAVLRTLGWERHLRRVGNLIHRVWRMPETGQKVVTEDSEDIPF